MATVHKIPASAWRAMIESAFLANSVRKTNMSELYTLALRQPEVVATTHPLYKSEQFGLPADAKVLVSNDGGIVGRTARARRLVRKMGKDRDKYLRILGEAIYQFNRREGLWLEAIVGLHPDFMVKAHLLSPITDAKNMLDWGFNFTPWMEPWIEIYNKSRQLDEPDILVFADPEWSHPEFPHGLVIIDEDENCIAILGLRYFGERKKGTLTLAWTIGVRHNMVACHGGIKTIGNHPPIAVFGLSGSGKSSITNSHDHAGTLRKDENVTVIHDDAFLIDLENDVSVALEPSLFDKTDAVEFDDPIIKYFYSAQNVAVTELPNGERKIVAKDIRNDNGRCIKFGLPGREIDIPKELSLSIVTELVREKIEWREWKVFPGLMIPKNGNNLFGHDYDKKYKPTRDTEYLQFLRNRMQDRITYLSNKRDIEHDMESSFIDPLVVARTVIDKILNPI